jgi:hypothetical protein
VGKSCGERECLCTIVQIGLILFRCLFQVDFGGIVGLSTTLLIGLYAQSRVYLGMARDGALPEWLAQVLFSPWEKCCSFSFCLPVCRFFFLV